MPLDSSQIQWDPVDPGKVAWDAPHDDGRKKLAEGTSAMDAFTIGAGRMGDRLYEGVKQGGMGIGAILSELLPDRLKRAAQEELAKRLMKQESMQADNTREYKHLEDAHPIATTVGEAAPLVAMPMLRAVEGAGAGAAAVNSAVSAALPSALEYGTAGERGTRAGVGALGGAVGSGLTSGAAKAFSGVKNVLTPEAQRLAALAEEKFGIPLDAAQKTGNKALQTVNAALEQMPVTSGREAVRINAQRDAFTREVMKTLGETTTEATPATLAAAKGRMGGEFERIFNKVSVNLDDEAVQGSIGRVLQESIDTLTPDQSRIVAKRAGEILSKIDEKGAIPGKAYQAWRSSVQKQAEQTGDEWLGTHLRSLYRAVDDAAYKSAAEAGEDGALRTVRGQYRNMKTISPLVAKSENGVISPSLLRGEVMRHTPDYATGGGGDLGDLARIGRAFIADQVPNSGTAQRQLAQSLMSGGTLGTVGWAASGDPMTGAKAAAGGLVLPKLAQTALRSGPVQNFLANGKPVDPVIQALMDRATRLGTLSIARGASE